MEEFEKKKLNKGIIIPNTYKRHLETIQIIERDKIGNIPIQKVTKTMIINFFENNRKMREAGASFTLEATPSDELIPYIDEMKAMAVKEVGAICHVTVARDMHNRSIIPILTEKSPEDYYKIWSVFDSELFDFKFSAFSQKRKEFCYAGDWTSFLDMGSGILHQCYCSLYNQNIFDDVTKYL